MDQAFVRHLPESKGDLQPVTNGFPVSPKLSLCVQTLPESSTGVSTLPHDHARNCLIPEPKAFFKRNH